MSHQVRKKPYLKAKNLCPLPKSNNYSKLTIAELFKVDPEYGVWMVKNLLAFRWAEDVRQLVNKQKQKQKT